MYYCLLENTYSDLNDCVGKLYECVKDDKILEHREVLYAKLMYETCKEFIELYEEYINKD
jgi:hypothetical protein